MRKNMSWIFTIKVYYCLRPSYRNHTELTIFSARVEASQQSAVARPALEWDNKLAEAAKQWAE